MGSNGLVGGGSDQVPVRRVLMQSPARSRESHRVLAMPRGGRAEPPLPVPVPVPTAPAAAGRVLEAASTACRRMLWEKASACSWSCPPLRSPVLSFTFQL